MDMIVGMVSSGISITEAYTFITMQFHNQFWKRKAQFEELKTAHEGDGCQPFPTYEEWEREHSSHFPSRHSISGCFMFDFWNKEKLYTCHTQLTSFDSNETWPSCDPTFASAGMSTNRYYHHSIIVRMAAPIGNWNYMCFCNA